MAKSIRLGSRIAASEWLVRIAARKAGGGVKPRVKRSGTREIDDRINEPGRGRRSSPE